MPFAVSQWPYSPDPRQSWFNKTGWNHSQVPPWKWILSTTGATGDVAIFNGGVLVEATSMDSDLTVFENIATLPFLLTVELNSAGTQEPVGGPPGFTKSQRIQIRQDLVLIYGGTLDQLYPVAIAVQSPFDMTELGPNNGSIDNPMIATPAKWNVEPSPL